ncbi:MAG: S-layer homology domain-containing protein [Vicinamibacterales bacterium]
MIRCAPVRWTWHTGCALLLLAACACAPKAPPTVAPGSERYPQFAYPVIPATLANAPPAVRQGHERGWAYLQSGDVKAAERAFADVLKRQATFFPAAVGLAYVDITRDASDRALERFERVLAAAPDYLPALLERADTLMQLERPADALSAYEAVLAVDGSLTAARTRVEGLRFQLLEQSVAQAHVAAQAGQLDRARELYEAALKASPESAFLLRDLARVELRANRVDEALAHATKASTLDPADAGAQAVLANIYEMRGQTELAIAAFERLQALDPTDATASRLAGLRLRAALARLPAEYQAIPQNDRLTRGELAALIGTRLEPLLRGAPVDSTVLVTDVRAHWAQSWIMDVTRARVMEVFDNHTFQPRNPVRRGDLAQAVSRVLTLLAQRQPAWQKTWMGSRHEFTDVTPDNLYYPAVALAVSAGILDADGGAFQAGRVVSGAEAVAAMERLQALAAQLNLSPRG